MHRFSVVFAIETVVYTTDSAVEHDEENGVHSFVGVYGII